MKRSKKSKPMPIYFPMGDADIESTAGHLSASERIQVAQKFDKWSSMLRLSAFQLESSGAEPAVRSAWDKLGHPNEKN